MYAVTENIKIRQICCFRFINTNIIFEYCLPQKVP